MKTLESFYATYRCILKQRTISLSLCPRDLQPGQRRRFSLLIHLYHLQCANLSISFRKYLARACLVLLKHGKVVEHKIIHDHVTKRSQGFGFIVFDNEQVVDDLLTNENMIDMEGTQVEIKKVEPNKSSSNLGRAFSFSGDSRTQMYNDGFSGYNNDPYSGLGSGGYGPVSYRALGGIDSRLVDYGGYSGSGSEFE